MLSLLTNPLAKLAEKSMAFVGITEDNYPDAKHYQFTRAAFVYSWLACSVSTFYTFFYWYIGAPEAALSLGAMSLVIVLCHVLYASGRSVLLSQIDLIFACFALAGVVVHTGGIATSSAAWLLGSVPGISALLFKRVEYIVGITALTIFLYSLIFILEVSGYNVHRLGLELGSTAERIYTFVHYIGFSMFFALILSIFSVTQKNLNNRLQQKSVKLEHVLANLNIVFQTIDQAIFTVEKQGVIGENRSEKFEAILHNSHNTLYSILDRCQLSSDDIATVKEVVDFAIGDEDFQFQLNSHLLPKKLTYRHPVTDMERILAVQWSPIANEGMVNSILVAIQDISDIEAAKTAIEEKNKHHEILLSLIENANQDLSAKMHTLSTLTRRLTAAVDEQELGEAKVLIHTLKGNTRQLNIKNISNYCHEIESIIEQDPNNFASVCHTLVDRLNEYCEAYHAHFADFDNELRDQALFADVQVLIEKLAPDSEVLDRLRALNHVDIRTLLRPVMLESDSIADELGKPKPSFVFDGLEQNMPYEYRDTLVNSLGHLVRNSIDHGIESAEERAAKSKAASGEIHIRVWQEGKNLRITYYDDGRGLDTRKILEKAHAAGIDTTDYDQEQICALIFHEDLTTSSSVTKFSGRGVGMTAVASDIERIGGAIHIEAIEAVAEYTRFSIDIVLPLVGEYVQEADAYTKNTESSTSF